jgi:hypothetical protein
LKQSVSKVKCLKHICDREPLTIQCLKCGHSLQILAGSRDRTCPACGRELANRFYERYQGIIASKRDLKFLTLTWKPVPRQDPQIVRQIGQAVIKLLHRQPYKRVWTGGLFVLECKKTPYGWFYYHVHAIISGGYVPQAQISKDWKVISGFPNVWIERIWRTPKRALRYVLKYLAKGFNFTKENDRQAFKGSMKGVRYVRSYGSFYDFQYRTGRHVPFPCPNCESVGCWVILEFFQDQPLDKPYLAWSGG